MIRTPYQSTTPAGATCYLNSLLQSLFMTPGFRRALYAWTYRPTAHGADESRCMARQLQRLFARMQLRCGGSRGNNRRLRLPRHKQIFQSRIESISAFLCKLCIGNILKHVFIFFVFAVCKLVRTSSLSASAVRCAPPSSPRRSVGTAMKFLCSTTYRFAPVAS